MLAGQGGHLHCWTLTDNVEEVESTYQCLPAAAYGRVTFPDIASLAHAGPGCILGCSSVGSVALWNYARHVSKGVLGQSHRDVQRLHVWGVDPEATYPSATKQSMHPGSTWVLLGPHARILLPHTPPKSFPCRGELLMARQEAGFLLHSICCLPPACLPMLSGQPGSKRPVIALACAERRSTNSAKAGQERHLALTLLWPEQIAISMLSPSEVIAVSIVLLCERVNIPQTTSIN